VKKASDSEQKKRKDQGNNSKRNPAGPEGSKEKTLSLKNSAPRARKNQDRREDHRRMPLVDAATAIRCTSRYKTMKAGKRCP